MDEATRLNQILEREAPAVARCLSPLGRHAAFPQGIPFQAGQARGTEINATIGQMTDGHGGPLPLEILESVVSGLDPAMTWLYAPVEGHRSVREAWRLRERKLAGDVDLETGLPVATHGLTHALSIVADLFADENTTVVLPIPHWGNYRLVFRLHTGARLATWPFFADGKFNVQGLADTLAGLNGKAILVINLPGNPTGYAPTTAETRALVEVVRQHPHPLVVVVDDAYQGFVYEPTCHPRSPFWDIAEALDPERHVAVKVDGATKELLFFSSRLGFLTTPLTGAAGDALLSKIKYVIRGTVGCPPGPSQALVKHALAHPGLDAAFASRKAMMQRRYDALKAGFADWDDDRVVPYPFNAAFFMLLGLRGLDSDAVRRQLIDEAGVGTIAFAEPNALRIAYCSLAEDQLPALVERIKKTLG